jgi:hypothetical protein
MMPDDRPPCAVLPGTGARTGGPSLPQLLRAEVIDPAIVAAGHDPFSIDLDAAESTPALIDLFLLCPLAVVEASLAERPDVAHAVGLREGVRPGRTVFWSAGQRDAPSAGIAKHVVFLEVDGDARIVDAAAAVALLRDALEHALGAVPAAAQELLRWEAPQDVPHAKTDRFREARYAPGIKADLAAARTAGADAVRDVHRRIRPLAGVEVGVLVDLLLSYRAVGAWSDAVALAEAMPQPLRHSTLVREQLAFALNRAGRRDDAARILEGVIAAGHGTAETWALLGRVRKDLWEAARRDGRQHSGHLLDDAIAAYLRGFELDWRDAYPGINAVTLMELREPPDVRRERLVPLVVYAVERRIDERGGDYWDHASRLELAVLARDEAAARTSLRDALANMRERWEAETTARNLRLIAEARERRGEAVPWAADIEDALRARATG